MCFVVNKFLHLFQVLRNFQNTATAINAPPSPLQPLIKLLAHITIFVIFLILVVKFDFFFKNKKQNFGKNMFIKRNSQYFVDPPLFLITARRRFGIL